MTKLTILCDVDAVVADLYYIWYKRYEEITGRHIEPSEVKSWDFGGLCLDKKILFGILDEPNLYDKVRMIPEADLAVKCLRIMGHRVVFVTSSTPNSSGQKMLWLAKYGFISGRDLYRDVVICHDKSLLKGDVMIDDAIHNLESFDGVRILFDSPPNRLAVEKGFVRLYNWHAVVQYIIRLVV